MTSAQAAGESSGTISKADTARQIAERALNDLTQQLEAGASDQLAAYLRAMSRFHSYSYGNILLICSQKPDATRVAGFHAWRKLGRTVKRGEKGIAIFAPMRFKTKEKAASAPDPAADDDDAPQIRFRVVYVFDVSQTEGDPLPEPARVGGEPGEALARLESAVREAGITLETALDLGGADGVSRGGTIALRAGLDPAERFSVLAHEWAHEMLHRCDAEKRPSKTVRETEAEAVAFVVCEAAGLDAGSAASDYIRLYRGDAETLAASLEQIQRAAYVIIKALAAPQQPQANEPASPTAAQAVSDRRQR